MIAEIIFGFTREPAIIMEWILVFVFVETGLMSGFKYLNAGRDRKSRYDVAFTTLFLGLGGRWVFVLLGNFYASSATMSDAYLHAGDIVQLAGGLAFVAIIEQKERLLSKWLYGAGIVSVLVAAGITAVLAPALFAIAVLGVTLVFLAYFILFYARIGRKTALESASRTATARRFTWFACLGIGHLLTAGSVAQLFEPAYRLAGDAMMLVSTPGIYLFIARLPPLIEIDWYSKLEGLFIMHSSGVCIYDYYFNKPEVAVHQNLITGAITSIRVLLEQITNQSGISVIKKDQSTTIIYPGKKLFGVLTCKEDLEVGRFLVKKLVDRIEAIYAPILDQWEGDLAVFEPVDKMRAEVFPEPRRKA